MARTLGIDYGEKRIGLALSDATGTVATPYRVIDATSRKAAIRNIVECVAELGIERIVIGLPLRMDGTQGPSAEKTLAFAEQLKPELTIPVEAWDERFSTMTAENALIEGGTRRAKRKQHVDKLAAQIFLQHYLDVQAGIPPTIPDPS